MIPAGGFAHLTTRGLRPLTWVALSALMAADAIAASNRGPPSPPMIDTYVPEVRPQPIAFPPNPPPLGALIADRPNPTRAHPDWQVLTPHAGEFFYPALSTHVFASERMGYMNRAKRKRLADYRTARDGLLEEVRGRLAAFAAMPEDERPAAWAQFAQALAPRLADLEKNAEALRHELAATAGWSDLRTWRLGRGALDRPRDELRPFEYLVVRAAVCYQPGLSPAQRWLLRERAMQLEADAFGRGTPPPPEGAFVWFSPPAAQLFLPPETPPDIAQGFLDYARATSALQDELQDALFRHERDRFDGTRNRALATLAQQQAARIAGLEDAAEQLRVALAVWGGLPRRNFVPPWPDSLRALVADYDARSAVVEQAYAEALEQAMKAYPRPTRAGRSHDAEAHARWKEQRQAHEAQERARLDREFAAQHAVLDELLDRIRAEIRQAFGAQAVLEDATRDGFLRALQRAFRRGEAYHEYDVAVLEPGLSPPLRRLLFTGAIAKLELPLPRPERQATDLTATPDLP